KGSTVISRQKAATVFRSYFQHVTIVTVADRSNSYSVILLTYINIRHLLINVSTPRDYKRQIAGHVTSVPPILGSNLSSPPLFPSRTSDAPHSIFYQLPISVLARD